MAKKLQVRQNDVVEVTTGTSKGRRGRVLRAIPGEGKVVVEGVNTVWKHLKRSQRRPSGGRIEVEAPIDVSNVMLLCQNRDCERYDRPVRARKRLSEDNTKQRVCIKCGKPIVAQQ